MKGDQLLPGMVSLPRTADILFEPALHRRRHRAPTTLPALRVLPGPEVSAPENWLAHELRQCAQAERYQEAAFLILGLSGLGAIIWAFLAVYA